MAKKTKILVVDDEGIIAMCLQMKLTEMGYDTPVVANSGEEAIEVAAQLMPDLTLIDIRLGGAVDGIEAARKIRDNCGAAIVFLSAFSDEETLHRAKLSEPFGYILKPVMDRELRIVVEIALYRSNAERALKLSEEKFRTVLETANDAVISADSKGQITYFNTAATRLFGYSAAEATGMSLQRIIPLREDDLDRRALDRLLSADAAPIERALTLKGHRKDDSVFPIELSIASWKTMEGIHFTAIIRDITERLRAEKNERRNRELQEINRAKDEFLAVVSHELRTPLTAMLGWTSLLRMGNLNDLDKKHAMEVIERNILTLKKLVEDLLDVSRIISGKLIINFKLLELLPLVQTAVHSVQPAALEKNIVLTEQYSCPEGTAVKADQNRIQQVLCNVLSNAIKFTPAGGRIAVRMECDQNWATISIADNGIGIEPAFLPHVFERFRQEDPSTTRVYDGMGLGLSIVRHLLELHGGNVHAESAGKGAGTTVVIRLPTLKLNAQNESPASNGSTEAGILENLRVLIVEDDADIRDFLALTLQHGGAEAIQASNAAEALEWVKSSKPDLMLCDIGLPGEDGYSLIQKIRALPPSEGGDMPAIALTGYARSDDRRAAMSAGFQLHITKPPDPLQLAAAIKHLTAHH